MEKDISLRERVAEAIYRAAFERGATPSPGWCWDKASEAQKEFCRKQADAAIAVITADHAMNEIARYERELGLGY